MILARQERPEESAARDELPAARGASLGSERRQIVRLADQCLDVGSLHRYRERSVEIAQHLSPIHLAFLDLVEIGLHVRRELDVEDIREALHHYPLDLLAELRREEPSLLECRVAAINDRRNDRGVGRWPAGSEH